MNDLKEIIGDILDEWTGYEEGCTYNTSDVSEELIQAVRDYDKGAKMDNNKKTYNEKAVIEDALNDLETVKDNYSDSDNSLYNAMETLESVLEGEE